MKGNWDITMTIITAILVGVIVVLPIAFLIHKNHQLTRELMSIKFRNPTELDLELATLPQILHEIKRRPIRYLFVLPQFSVDEEEKSVRLANIAVEGSGMPHEVAKDVLRAAASMMDQNMGTFHPYAEEEED